MSAPSFAASCICGTLISTGVNVACVTTDALDALPLPLAQQQQSFGGPSECPVASTSSMLGDQGDHLP